MTDQTKQRMVKIRNRDYRALQSAMDQLDEDGQDAILDYLENAREESFQTGADVATIRCADERAQREAASAAAAQIAEADKLDNFAAELTEVSDAEARNCYRAAADDIRRSVDPSASAALAAMLEAAEKRGLSSAAEIGARLERLKIATEAENFADQPWQYGHTPSMALHDFATDLRHDVARSDALSAHDARVREEVLEEAAAHIDESGPGFACEIRALKSKGGPGNG